MRRRRAGESGQSTVEVVAMLPLLVAAALACGQVLLAGAASEFAGNASEAAALAMLQGGDPAAAARDAVPGWSRAHLRVQVRGDSVKVAVRPAALIGPLADALTVHAEASAAG